MQSSVLQTALAHRSIRKFKPQAIAADILRSVLSAGQPPRHPALCKSSASSA